MRKKIGGQNHHHRVEYLLDLIGQRRVIDFGKEGLKQSAPQNTKYRFDTSRPRNVIDLAAEKLGWANTKAAAGRALGIAAHRSFLTYVAVVAAVEVGQSEPFEFRESISLSMRAASSTRTA